MGPRASALAYGSDETTARLHDVVREVFEHPSARVFPVTSGTAANSLSLSAMLRPWQAVFCHESAHIITDEAGATSLLSGGALMVPVGGDNARIGPEPLRTRLAAARWGDHHNSQPAVLSLTQTSEYGTVYSLDEIATLTSIARDYRMRSHLDGARFANALVAIGASPAEMTWKAGIDALSLGATKNGALSCEAIVTFDDSIGEELYWRTKRSGHVTSKMRFQSAQMIAYLTDGLYLSLAGNANERMAELAAGLTERGVEFIEPPAANIAFVRLDDVAADALERAGLFFYRISPGVVRFVTSWQTTADDVAGVLAAFDAIATPAT